MHTTYISIDGEKSQVRKKEGRKEEERKIRVTLWTDYVFTGRREEECV